MTKKDIGPPPDDFRMDPEPGEGKLPVGLQKPDNLLSRRDFIKRTAQFAVAGALIPGTLAQLLPFIAPDAFGGGGAGPVIKRDEVTNAKTPVTIDHPELAGDPPKVLVAEWAFLPATIYKVKKSVLEGSSAKRGYNTAQYAIQHPTEPDNALMVYEAKCKHLGCTIGWDGTLGGSKDVADYNEDGVNDGRILCPCHQGQYDIYDLANNVPGTPPPAPLNVVNFDVVPSFTDELGETHSNVIFGIEKLIQDGPRQANADDGPYTLLEAGTKEIP